MGLPQLKYLFVPLFIYFIVYFVRQLFTTGRAKTDLGVFLRHSLLYLILLSVYGLAILYQSDFLLPVKEFISGAVVLLIFFLTYYFLKEKKILFIRFKQFFVQLMIVVTSLTAMLGIVKLVFALFNTPFPLSPEISQNTITASIPYDYNFFALAMVFGLLSILYQLYQESDIGKVRLTSYNLLMLCFTVNILFSQSRRGFVVLLLILVFIAAGRIFQRYKYRKPALFWLRKTDIFLFSFIFLFILGYGFMAFTSDDLKKQILTETRIYKSNFRNVMTNTIVRYGSIIELGLEKEKLYYRLWNTGDQKKSGLQAFLRDWFDDIFLNKNKNYNLFNADFSEGLKTWKERGKVKANLIEVNNTRGILIDAKTPYSGIENSFYTDVGDTILIGAFVQVLEWDKQLRLETRNTYGDSPVIAEIPEKWENDGKWHWVSLNISYQTFGPIPFIAGGGSRNQNSISYWSKFHVTETGKGDSTNIVPGIPRNVKYTSLEKRIQNQSNNRKITESEGEGFNPHASLSSFLRNLLGKEDTDSGSPKSPWIQEPNNTKDIGRKGRWMYALSLFQNHSLTRKLFGNGFHYLNKYAEHFKNSPRRIEYPHNPLLSAILYSGIIGGLFYMFFLVYSIILYIRHLKFLRYFFLLYLVTGLFVVISGNSHFSIPAFVFLSFLPYFFQSIKVINLT
jgi:hypothetical protein